MQPTPQLQPPLPAAAPRGAATWPVRWCPLPGWETAHTSAVLRASPRSCKWVRSDDGLIVLIVPAVSATCIGRSEVLRPAQAVLPLSPARQGRKRCCCCWLWALIMHGRKDSESVAQGLYEVQSIFIMWFFTGISCFCVNKAPPTFQYRPWRKKHFFLWIAGNESLFDKKTCVFVLCPLFKFVVYVKLHCS